jgi:hypothetical protein
LATFFAGIKGKTITAKNAATSNTINIVLIFNVIIDKNEIPDYFATFLAGIKGKTITAKNAATSNTINIVLIF